ncbi:MAG: DUF192 domain-containing protein [Dehalococcoidia bacterium]|nr:DUF192 domain-containing protein [Dehalococcoidia bacterium]
MLTALVTFVAFVAFLACDGAGNDTDAPRPELPTVEVRVEGNGRSETLTVELAITTDQRQKGLMFREAMPEDAGMLFLFPRQSSGGFWMRNTYLPLSIAYLAADGTVLEIRSGTPLDETILTPAQPYYMVLEVNQGWFERHGLGVGSKVVVPPGLPAAS